MRRIIAVAALAASLIGLSACSAGSSIPSNNSTTTQSGLAGGFIHAGR